MSGPAYLQGLELAAAYFDEGVQASTRQAAAIAGAHWALMHDLMTPIPDDLPSGLLHADGRPVLEPWQEAAVRALVAGTPVVMVTARSRGEAKLIFDEAKRRAVEQGTCDA